mmetsp:Transcript_40028/g.93972  ORF Transcript_40028/g.93972 Transcript_40028/m.93972 type:complete len:364 (+) Transcript_40028:1133-2224(+)
MTLSSFVSKAANISAMEEYWKFSFSSATRNSSISIDPDPSSSISSKRISASFSVSSSPVGGVNPSNSSILFPIKSPISPKIGVRLMDMMTDAVSNFARELGRTPRSCAILNITKENSPPPESVKATLAACPDVKPRAGPSAYRTAALVTRKAAIPVRSVGHSRRTSIGSRLAPAVMKKTPSRIPSNGLISAWICGRYLFPASNTPAANAPVEAERPRRSAICPMATTTSSAAATKVSVERAAATISKTFLRARLPAQSTAANPNVALANRIPSSVEVCGPDPASNGNTTRRGATAKSCKSRMDRPAMPSLRSSQPFSFRTGSTKAEDESAPADAMQKACTGDERMGRNKPSSRGINISTILRM